MRYLTILLAIVLFACGEEEKTTTDQPKEDPAPESFMDYFAELTPEVITRESDATISESEIKGLQARRKRGDWLILDKDTSNNFIRLQYKETGKNLSWKFYPGEYPASIFLRELNPEEEAWWDLYLYDADEWTLAVGDLPQVTIGDFLDTSSYLFDKESFSGASVGVVPFFDDEKRLSFRLVIPEVMELADSLYVKFVPERDMVRSPWIEVVNGSLNIAHERISSDWEPAYKAVFAFHSGEDLPGWNECLSRIEAVADTTGITVLTGKSYEKSILIDVDKGPLIDISGITGEDEIFEGYILIQEGSRNRYVPYGSCGSVIARMKSFFHIKEE